MEQSKPIQIRGQNGFIGIIDPAEKVAEDQHISLRLADGQVLRVPVELFQPLEDGTYLLPVSDDELKRFRRLTAKETVAVIPLLKEDLNVIPEEKTRARVLVHKSVKEREEWVDEPGFEEKLDIKRVPKMEVVQTPPEVRTEGDTLIIPILEEILVVEKRLVLKEEVHISKWREETRKPQRVTLREEEVKVERLEETGTEPDSNP